MIPPETIQEITNQIDIIDIIDSFVKLRRRGANYLGLCPFHNEKTPSFTVSPTKEIFKCFGCGKSGNAITFIMEHEKLSYPEALKWLAARYNVEIEEQEVSPEIREKQQASESLFIINNFARDFFSDQLLKTDEGLDVGFSYLKERGFNEETIKKFEIGYNPSAPDTLANLAIEKQYNKELLLKSGLVHLRNGRLHDNYQGRIIFPIHNQSGKTCGFGARLIGKNDKAPKYINTPENEIYIKSKTLYGLWFARQEIGKADECLLVEGYTDVVSLHQAGVENVVASGGTSLTPDQLRLIKKFTPNLTILYDSDEAGIKAALRGMDIALAEGLNVQLVLLPEQEDPDSFVRKEGSDAFHEYVKTNKKDFILFQLDHSLKKAGDNPHLRAQAVNQIAESISKMNRAEDFSRQQDYVRKASEILKIEEAGLHNLINKFIRERLAKDTKQFDAKPPREYPEKKDVAANQVEADALQLLDSDLQHEEGLVRCLVEYGHFEWDDEKTVAEYLFREWLDEDLIKTPHLLEIMKSYRELYDKGVPVTQRNFIYHEDPELSKIAISLIDFPYVVSKAWEEKYEMKVPTREENFRKDLESTLMYFELKKIKKLIHENEQELKKTETLDEQMLLIQTHSHLKKMEIELTAELGTVILK